MIYGDFTRILGGVVADQLINSSDFVAVIGSSSIYNGTGTRLILYSPPLRDGVQYSADLVNLAVRVDMTSFAPAEIDLEAYSNASEILQRQIVTDAIFSSQSGWLELRVLLIKSGVAVELVSIPCYNSGLPSQVVQLNRFFQNGAARIAHGSQLAIELHNTGSGPLQPGDSVQIWGHAIEEAWVRDGEIIALGQAVQALAASTDNQTQTITQLLGTVEAVLELQSGLIANQNDLIQLLSTTGINPGGGNNNNNTEDVDRMRTYFNPSGSVDVGSGSVTVPTEPPAAGAVAPTTLGGITLRAGMEIVWERPYDGSAFDARHDEYTYTLYSASGALRWRPISRRFIGNNDGTWMVYSHHWDGTQWVQHPHY